jgi:hypothetical protein
VRFALFIICTIFIGFLLEKVTIQWMLKLIILGLSSIAIALTIGFVSIKGLYHIIKHGE